MVTLDAFPELPAARPLHILYAEDLRQMRELISDMLGREGHAVETADDGAAALQRLTPEGCGFDLLITDHNMPRLNGLDLVREVRNLSFAGKIIVFSAELSDALRAQYRDLGVDLILAKPLFPVTIRQIVNQLFAGPETAPAR